MKVNFKKSLVINKIDKSKVFGFWIFGDAEKEKRREWRFLNFDYLNFEFWFCRVNNEKSVADYLNIF